MTPFVDLALEHGLEARLLSDRVRDVYLRHLNKKIASTGRKASAARLAQLTGLDRHEVQWIVSRRNNRVKRILERTALVKAMMAILAEWYNSTQYTVAYGIPRDLLIESDSPNLRFATLVERVAPDQDAQVVLNELIKVNAVEIHENNYVRCISRTFVMRGFDPTTMVDVGSRTGSYARSMLANISRTTEKPPYFDQFVVNSEKVSTQFKEEALAYAWDVARNFIETADHWWERTEIGHRDETGSRVGLGIFLFEEVDNSEIDDVPSLADEAQWPSASVESRFRLA